MGRPKLSEYDKLNRKYYKAMLDVYQRLDILCAEWQYCRDLLKKKQKASKEVKDRPAK